MTGIDRGTAARTAAAAAGGAAALPIWIGFMEKALAKVPESYPEMPKGMIPIVVNDPAGKTIREMIYAEHLPPAHDDDSPPDAGDAPRAPVVDALPRALRP